MPFNKTRPFPSPRPDPSFLFPVTSQKRPLLLPPSLEPSPSSFNLTSSPPTLLFPTGSKKEPIPLSETHFSTLRPLPPLRPQPPLPPLQQPTSNPYPPQLSKASEATPDSATELVLGREVTVLLEALVGRRVQREREEEDSGIWRSFMRVTGEFSKPTFRSFRVSLACDETHR